VTRPSSTSPTQPSASPSPSKAQKNIHPRGHIIFYKITARAGKLSESTLPFYKFPIWHGTIRYGYLPRNSSRGPSDI
jgi:hypothetical protein